MFKLSCKIPKTVYLACSAGSDSMFALNFLKQGRRNVKLIYYHHGTEFGDECYNFLSKLKKSDTPLITGYLEEEKPRELSQEEFWRIKRYEFFNNFYPVITVHHLDDLIESVVMGVIRGRIRTIASQRNNLLRPFLNITKQQILDYCNRYSIEYLDDPSNLDTKYDRNKIRHEIIPKMLEVNPGLYKSIRKLTNDHFY